MNQAATTRLSLHRLDSMGDPVAIAAQVVELGSNLTLTAARPEIIKQAHLRDLKQPGNIFLFSTTPDTTGSLPEESTVADAAAKANRDQNAAPMLYYFYHTDAEYKKQLELQKKMQLSCGHPNGLQG